MTLLWVAAVCLIATMFFSAAEMAFIAANRVRIRHLAEEGYPIAAEYLESFRNPERTLATAMMGVTIAHIVASSAATVGLLPLLGGLAPLVVTAALTPVMLVFGEIIPKAIAREWATPLVLKLYRLLTWSSVLMAPFVVIAHTVVTWLLRVFGAGRADTRHFVSREELKALLSMNPGEADVTTQEAELIDKIFDLGDTTVREVMVPLVEAVTLPETASWTCCGGAPRPGRWPSSCGHPTMCPRPPASMTCCATCSEPGCTWPSSWTSTGAAPAS
jgi:putative hemolysin